MAVGGRQWAWLEPCVQHQLSPAAGRHEGVPQGCCDGLESDVSTDPIEEVKGHEASPVS